MQVIVFAGGGLHDGAFEIELEFPSGTLLPEEAAMTKTALTNHEERIVDALLGVIDYASRILIAGYPGSHYQRSKVQEMHRELDRLTAALDKGLVSAARSEVLAERLRSEAVRYTLGRLLVESGHLGGTA